MRAGYNVSRCDFECESCLLMVRTASYLLSALRLCIGRNDLASGVRALALPRLARLATQCPTPRSASLVTCGDAIKISPPTLRLIGRFCVALHTCSNAYDADEQARSVSPVARVLLRSAMSRRTQASWILAACCAILFIWTRSSRK